jgi:hypothetical protein
VVDREIGDFLDAPERRTLLAGVPIVPVPVLQADCCQSRQKSTRLKLELLPTQKFPACWIPWIYFDGPHDTGPWSIG